jgi:hypothetical protein
MIRYLPWRQCAFAIKTKGYPSYRTFRMFALATCTLNIIQLVSQSIVFFSPTSSHSMSLASDTADDDSATSSVALQVYTSTAQLVYTGAWVGLFNVVVLSAKIFRLGYYGIIRYYSDGKGIFGLLIGFHRSILRWLDRRRQRQEDARRAFRNRRMFSGAVKNRSDIDVHMRDAMSRDAAGLERMGLLGPSTREADEYDDNDHSVAAGRDDGSIVNHVEDDCGDSEEVDDAWNAGRRTSQRLGAGSRGWNWNPALQSMSSNKGKSMRRRIG